MIQKNWTELIKPNKKIEAATTPKRFATVVAEPLERGFGLTLGNALRRILLSSLQGAAVTAVQIDGVLHEFSSIPGVREDVTDIVLNIKQIALRMDGDGPKRMRLRAQGPGEVKAGQIETGHDIEILNPDLVLCTLDQGADAEHRVHGRQRQGLHRRPRRTVRKTRRSASSRSMRIFSPVRKVSYKVENSRVGQVTDYDKLSMQVETNGAVTPEDSRGHRRAHPAGPAAALHQLRRADRPPARKRSRSSRRSTRTCCARSTSSSCRSARPTA